MISDRTQLPHAPNESGDPHRLQVHREPPKGDVPFVPTDEPVVAAMLRFAPPPANRNIAATTGSSVGTNGTSPLGGSRCTCNRCGSPDSFGACGSWVRSEIIRSIIAVPKVQVLICVAGGRGGSAR